MILAACYVVFATTPFAVAAGRSNSSGGPACHESLPSLYRRAAPAVVTITSQTIRPYQFTNRVQQGVGSGIIFDSRGLVLTNDHVVAGANAIQVTLDNGNTYPAKVVGADALFDLAVLHVRVPSREKLPTLSLGDSSSLEVGQKVAAIGNPLGLDQTLTHGIISGLNRKLPDSPLTLSANMIQTDTPINPGNSGGPLLDLCGRVVGVNAEIAQGGQNVGFAIPINLARAVLPSLLEKGRVVRPWVGFHGQLIDRDTAQILGVSHAPGFLVEAVDRGSAAAKAGMNGGTDSIAIDGTEFLIGGDMVTRIDGIRLDSSQALAKVTRGIDVGKTLRVTYYRGSHRHTIQYTLTERPPALDARLVQRAQEGGTETAVTR